MEVSRMNETKNVQDAACGPGQPGASGRKYAGKAVLLILLATAVGAYFVWPPYRDVIDSIFSAFAIGDFTAVRNFVERYGTMAAYCHWVYAYLEFRRSTRPRRWCNI